jgi:hypothetical protein
MDGSDLIDSTAEAMGGESSNVNDMQNARKALLEYAVNEIPDYSYVDNLEQVLGELGIEII